MSSSSFYTSTNSYRESTRSRPNAPVQSANYSSNSHHPQPFYPTSSSVHRVTRDYPLNNDHVFLTLYNKDGSLVPASPMSHTPQGILSVPDTHLDPRKKHRCPECGKGFERPSALDYFLAPYAIGPLMSNQIELVICVSSMASAIRKVWALSVVLLADTLHQVLRKVTHRKLIIHLRDNPFDIPVMRTILSRKSIVFLFAILTIPFLLSHFTGANRPLGVLREAFDGWQTSDIKMYAWNSQQQSPGEGPEFDDEVALPNELSPLPNPQKPTKQTTKGNVVKWQGYKMPETELLVHAPGWNVIDSVYLFNGTFYVVSSKHKRFPDRALFLSAPAGFSHDVDVMHRQLPTDTDMQILSPEEASTLFPSYGIFIGGTTFILTDTPEFVHHYYHWSAEVLLGFWRTYSSLDVTIKPTGETNLSSPERILMPNIPQDQWSDYARMNTFITKAAFPSIAIEFKEDWSERASMELPYVFERVVLGDRIAAMRSPVYTLNGRMTGAPFKLPGSPYWWSPIRHNVVESVGGDSQAEPGNVITYVSRQEWGRRMLLPEDHERLVKELYKLRDQYKYEVNIVSMDQMTRKEQVKLASRTTIMIGVHGNGLTALLWMKPTKRSAVMEFYYGNGFTQDYEWTTRALGIKHYGFWNDKYFTAPDLPPLFIPDGFQGNNIRIDGRVVAQLCHEHLSQAA
ncbi:hypothetical protein Clacol_002752 [Clathrus columnatus]|uniref:Glycosyltransferase 61 catalytic domain-containing protein n=1 Tax=Clathrus columnatus TaxID=1419009 RepID=A0AAV5A1N1_9AGAM|nr:hypothetical protein Clacol_002752 [Clathrus columnatus]